MRMRISIVVAGAALPLALWAALPLVSAGSSQGRVASLQHKIAAKQAFVNRVRGRERLLTTTVTSYTRRINTLQAGIVRLQRRQSRLQADLDRKRAVLVRTQTSLRAERARLARLKARLAQSRIVLARRLREMYTADQPDIVTVLLSSHGFAELLERGEFISRINEQDTRIIEAVRSAKAEATRIAKRLATLEARQRSVATAVLARRDEVAGVRLRLVDQRVGYAHARSAKARLLHSARAVRHRAEENLAALQREQDRIQGILRVGTGSLPAGPIRRGAGMFIWPVNGPITSPFCERRAWEACHPGIDIGVPSGTPIRAAGTGRVAIAGWVGGYGNYTCIQHTGALSTCYGHQSRIGVRVGQGVRQGQVIGYTGCTGRCYGPHLHFEVRVNGAVVNPLNYL